MGSSRSMNENDYGEGTKEEAVSVEEKPVPAARRPHLIKEKDYSSLEELFRHLIESFDYMVEEGLDQMVKNLKPVQVVQPSSNKKLRIWLLNPKVYPPQKERLTRAMQDGLYPSECRQAKISYTGKFIIDVCIQCDDGTAIREKFNFGQFPIMLKSKLCHLRIASSKKLISLKEEPSEMGGYFILNGLERVMRLLILPKRNYPMSMVRNSFRERQDGYTDKAAVIRDRRQLIQLQSDCRMQGSVDRTSASSSDPLCQNEGKPRLNNHNEPESFGQYFRSPESLTDRPRHCTKSKGKTTQKGSRTPRVSDGTFGRPKILAIVRGTIQKNVGKTNKKGSKTPRVSGGTFGRPKIALVIRCLKEKQLKNGKQHPRVSAGTFGRPKVETSSEACTIIQSMDQI